MSETELYVLIYTIYLFLSVQQAKEGKETFDIMDAPIQLQGVYYIL